MVGEIKVNYNLECEKILNSLDLNNKKTLLLHACCAPCSSAVLERISKYFKITIFCTMCRNYYHICLNYSIS